MQGIRTSSPLLPNTPWDTLKRVITMKKVRDLTLEELRDLVEEIVEDVLEKRLQDILATKEIIKETTREEPSQEETNREELLEDSV